MSCCGFRGFNFSSSSSSDPDTLESPDKHCDVDERSVASFCRETSGEIVSAATFVPRQLGLPVETGSHPPPHE